MKFSTFIFTFSIVALVGVFIISAILAFQHQYDVMKTVLAGAGCAILVGVPVVGLGATIWEDVRR